MRLANMERLLTLVLLAPLLPLGACGGGGGTEGTTAGSGGSANAPATSPPARTTSSTTSSTALPSEAIPSPAATGIAHSFAYAADDWNSTVTNYGISATADGLTTLETTTVEDSSLVDKIMVHPSGKLIYVANREKISALRVDPVSGALTLLNGTRPFGAWPMSAAIVAGGRFLCVSKNYATDSAPPLGIPQEIATYRIDTGTGELTPAGTLVIGKVCHCPRRACQRQHCLRHELYGFCQHAHQAFRLRHRSWNWFPGAAGRDRGKRQPRGASEWNACLYRERRHRHGLQAGLFHWHVDAGRNTGPNRTIHRDRRASKR